MLMDGYFLWYGIRRAMEDTLVPSIRIVPQADKILAENFCILAILCSEECGKVAPLSRGDLSINTFTASIFGVFHQFSKVDRKFNSMNIQRRNVSSVA
jgi:hypothetical protein